MGRRLVCVSPYVPYAGIDHAGGEYLRRYLTAAADVGWDVSVIAPSTAANRAARERTHLEVDLHPAPGAAARAAALLRSGVPVRTGPRWLRDLTPLGRRWLDEADLVDLQWADSLWQAPVIRHACPGARIVGLAHDLRTQSLTRALRSGHGRARLEAALSLPAARRHEALIMNCCDRVHVFKESDRAALRAAGVRSEIDLTPVPVSPVGSAPDPSSGRVLFCGAMFRPENAEAARWLLEQVWPLVVRGAPGSVLRIAGSRPPEWLVERAAGDVEVTGYLPELTAAYRDVACVAVPLRRGAGVKFKTVEAMAAGFPVVSTRVGAEGVAELVGRAPAVVADDAVGFARGILAQLSRADAHPVTPPVDFEGWVRRMLAGTVEVW